VLGQFKKEFGRRRIESITSEETFSFLAFLAGAKKQSTRYSRSAHLRAFFNHILDRYKLNFVNPCDSLIIKRVFRPPRIGIRTVIDRETIDEIIYTSLKIRDRLILELQARAGMLIGEVLKLTATFASRSGVPLEVVSEIILRHRNLSTTQRYLGKVSESEAASWIGRIYE